MRRTLYLLAGAALMGCPAQPPPPQSPPPTYEPAEPAPPAEPAEPEPPPSPPVADAPAAEPAAPQPPAIRPPEPPPPPRTFNPEGWTKLGEKWVTGRRDRDVFRVGAKRGAFTHITVVVTESDIEMHDVAVTFGNKQVFSPELRHTFREGTRSRAIDLPGHARNIAKIAFRYSNLPGGGRAKVTVYGRDRTPPSQPPTWDDKGWTKLGEKRVNGRRDRDVLRVGAKAGAFTHLTFVVTGGAIEMYDIEITFGNNAKQSPEVRHHFKNGQRTRAIDLQGGARNIKRIAFRYGKLPGTGNAQVAVYGRDARPAPQPPRWRSEGWTKLGDKVVNGRRDRDVLRVGKRAGAFTKLALVVYDSDLEMHDLVVTFGNGERFSPELRHVFKNGTRSRVIDLPGNARKIRDVKFRYGNLPGTGNARVELWARTTATPGAAKPAWTPDGWTRLGRKVVHGKRDRDVIRVGKGKGPFKRITVQVDGSDVEMFDIVVTFGNGKTFSPAVRHRFKEGSRTRVIDLPGDKRRIRNVAFRYGNLPGKGRATVTAWAK